MIAALIARVLARPAVTDWLIRRAMRTPYTHITSADGSQVYMRRYWLFNPYPADSSGNRPWWQFPISIRLHQIMREDDDTAALRFGEYHRITEVSEGGVWTLFVTGRYRGTWGFLVNGKKVPWREYLLAKGES